MMSYLCFLLSCFTTSVIAMSIEGCEDPGTPAFGSRSGTFDDGDVLTFECFFADFTLIGESTLTCNNGQYNDDAPVCKVRCDPLSDQSDCPGGVPCNAEGFCEIDPCGPQPELPSCSIEFCTSFGPNFALAFCDPCGPQPELPSCSIEFCTSFGPDFASDFCQGCEDPGTPAFGSRSGTFEHGDVLTFECFEGFTLIGESTLTCNNGQYNDDAPVCKVPCDPPAPSLCFVGAPCGADGVCPIDPCGPQPEFPSCSIEFCTSFGPSFALDFCDRCGPQPELPSCSIEFCTSFGPDFASDFCQGCEDPGTPAFGSRSGTFEHGDVLTFECFEGFTLIGESTLTCNNGQYDDGAPVCKVPCDPPNDPSQCPGGGVHTCDAEDFCLIDACNSSTCFNGATCEQGFCTCAAGFEGTTCEVKLTYVECGTSSMIVNIAKQLVPGDASAVHFLDQSCSGVDSSSTEITLTTNYNECGTILEEDNTTITFFNVITYSKPDPEAGTEITRNYQMQVKVECCLNKEEVISGSFRPQLGEVSFSDKGSGDFSLRLERFQKNAFVDLELDTSSVVWHYKDLFFAVRLESVQDVGVVIDRCWATASEDSETTPQHSLISSGCPEDDTVAINRSLGLHREGFSLKSFAFVGDYTEVYIHCSVKVCRAAEAQEIRDAGCPSEDEPPNGQTPLRKRRSLSVMSTQTISNGPIHIRRSTSDMATNDLSSYNPFAVLLLGMIATLVAMAIMMGVVKLVRILPDISGYQQVPFEGI
ncbi:CUB and sushi domain-containing protein 2 isoform X2 [Strongylocentrotus purpuratus]|uniref:Uncharacterized protein n=1 Tax=Strongylocentrotus purpuratus TaxID=7668 RepID=A0A7M7NXY6_STRPU|nr:CUB and sushi domain-containing protein 2 isoform X2 [Strongylocentrotus purpuratus]